MNLLIFDTETTGLKDPELIQFGALYKKNIDGNYTTEEIIYYMKPETPILPASTVIHGISQEQANGYQNVSDIIPEIYNTLIQLETPLTFVGHNIKFDIDVMNRQFEKYLNKCFNPKFIIDTLRLSKHLIPFNQIGGYSLDSVFYYFFPDKLNELIENRKNHSAIIDSTMTYQILIELKKLCDIKHSKELCWEEVIDFSATLFDLSEEEWQFGKHKGIKFKNTPKGYIAWCLNSDFAKDPKNIDIVYTLKKYL